MPVCFPALPRHGLGVGLDLPWGPGGFMHDPRRGDVLAPSVATFLGSAASWSHAFFSWQPRDRAPPELDDYAKAWDSLRAALPDRIPLALHHTALNLGALTEPPRAAHDALLRFTNQLVTRNGLRWINEDVGLWSLAGRPVPYPLPPLLTDGGLASTIHNVRRAQDALTVPLVLEFPGFSRGASVVLGDWDAYDFFRALAEETAAPVTLDTGHLLSWRWWSGRRGDALFADLERLPLAHCFEVHLSGCEIDGEEFIDAHHGRLLDEQLVLLERLIARCPNLRAVTFEDPRLTAAGALEPGSAHSLARLEQATRRWASSPVTASPPPAPSWRSIAAPASSLVEDRLAACLYDPTAPSDLGLREPMLRDAARAVRAMVRGRRHRGTGGLTAWFPRTIEAWRARHPNDLDLDELVAAFCASTACYTWREGPGLASGTSLEEALFTFFEHEGVGDASEREEELLSALLRALAVSPRAAFTLPPSVRRAPGGHYAVSRRLVLHAALDGRYLHGPVTPPVARLLRGEGESGPLRDELARLRLLPNVPTRESCIP